LVSIACEHRAEIFNKKNQTNAALRRCQPKSSPRAPNQQSAHLLDGAASDPRKVARRFVEVLEDRLDALAVRREDEHLAREGVEVLAQLARVPAVFFDTLRAMRRTEPL